ncbi:MAG: 4-(cytidine 5'-diphospho)-2-C-methyl-D-erythritol kinase [Acutalibacteraceae bacterium]
MTEKRTIRANAKINLFLDILGLLDNGYHSLYTIMQSVGLCDTVTVTLNSSDEIRLSCDSELVLCDNRNTAYKAAKVFFEKTGIKGGADIHIKKRIPISAGLAGGSADAAAVLLALNELMGVNACVSQLCEIGINIGADVPFCLVGGTALSQNMGEVLSRLPDLPECAIVLAKPSRGVSTKEAYEAYDCAWWIKHPKDTLMLDAVSRRDLDGISRYCENVFEQVIDVPKRADIKYIMREAGAIAACMSGSGSTVFGLFGDESDARKCSQVLRTVVPEVFVTKPHKYGVYFE